MIHLEQDQILKADSKIRVAVPTGDYNETDLIECYVEGEDPNTPTCMYQAQFVAFGGPVYEQSEELTEEQLNALIADTPIREVINNRKLIDGKKPATKYVGRIVKRKGKLELKKLRTDIVDETATTTKKVVLKKENVINNATSTPATSLDTSNATSTTPVYNASNVSTSTEPVYSNASSTPSTVTASSIEPVYNNATSTDPVYNNASSTPETVVASSTATSSQVQEVVDSGITGTEPVATSTNPFSPIEEVINETSTSTSSTDLGTGTDTASPASVSEPISTPMVPSTSTDTSTTTDQIVAYAKRKIAKKLGL